MRIAATLAPIVAASCSVLACGGSTNTSKEPATQSETSTSFASPPPDLGPRVGGAAADACAGDPWVGQLFGKPPTLSSTMFLEQMKRAPALGAYGAKMDHLEGDAMYELEHVQATISERYEWPASARGDVPLVFVVRNAFGDPRTFKQGNTFLYGPPVNIGNNVQEYPPSPETQTQHVPFVPMGGRHLFTFADGTWVRVDAWLAQRARAVFASGKAPPRPNPAADVAWEVCLGPIDDYSHVWGAAKPDRAILRIHASPEPDLEMVYRFASPALAIQADREQRQRCASPQGQKNNKGIFDVIPPCGSITSSNANGVILTMKAGSQGLVK